MNNPFKVGDQKQFERIVQVDDTAEFDSGEVHPVYATFALTRDAEWACRLFVLEMKSNDEEGIGTFVEVSHQSPALLGQKVIFTATLEEVNEHEIICNFDAHVEGRLIAKGKTGQKILRKEKLEKLFSSLR